MCAGFSLGKTALQDHVSKLPKPVYEVYMTERELRPVCVCVCACVVTNIFGSLRVRRFCRRSSPRLPLW